MVRCLVAVLVLFFFSSISKSERERAQELTHIVMPFHPRQLNAALENMRNWISFTPCQSQRNVSLIFYLAKSDTASASAELLNQFTTLPLEVKKCFAYVNVTHETELEVGDSYLSGSRVMFEKMVSGKMFYGPKRPSFVMYMEPDCVPVQKYWLDALIDAVKPPNEYFWMKGSSFRGSLGAVHKNPPAYTLLHINGNAVYNVGDGELYSFYRQKVRPFLLKHKASEAYDTNFFKYLLWNPENRPSDYLHLFAYTNVIQNMWHSAYTPDEIFDSRNTTYLVHGGKMKSK